ncbi:MAG: hypothetical protein Q9227_002137 [Pyrenula ochraceoflavens]
MERVKARPLGNLNKADTSATRPSDSTANVPSLPTPIAGQKRTSSGRAIADRARHETPRDLAHDRDSKRCVLTKAGEPNEMVHIYPHSMCSETAEFHFWMWLEHFWPVERVEKWREQVSSQGTEVCDNFICLSPNARAYWRKAYFALKPLEISEDKTRLDIQFFWLAANSYNPTKNLLERPALSAADCGPNSTKLFNHETDRKIESGDIISLTTDGPELRPLPSFTLLEMQWFLNRITAMSGAAELPDEDEEDQEQTAYNSGHESIEDGDEDFSE